MKLLNTISSEKSIAILIDPDKADNIINNLENFINHGLKYLLIGGSFVSNYNNFWSKIEKFNIIKILFPGSITQLSDKVNAILLLSVVSSRNPYYLIDAHLQSAPILEKLNDKGIEIISTAYMLYDPGVQTSAHFITQSRGLPMDKPDISVYTALAANFIGMKLIYLDAGSGAPKHIPPNIVKSIREKLPNIPIIVGGGINSTNTIMNLLNAGANLIAIGTLAENNPHQILEILKKIN